MRPGSWGQRPLGSLLILAVLAASSLAWPTTSYAQEVSAPAADPTLDVARQLRDAGRLEDSVVAFQKHLESHPEAWLAHYELALVLMSLRQLSAAEQHLQAGLLAAPSQAALWARLGQVYLLKSDLQHAEMSLARARDLNPQDVGVRFNLGKLYETQARDAEALAEYLAFLDHAGEDPRAVSLRMKVARYYETTNRPDEALAHYRVLAQQDPTRVKVIQTIGDMLYRKTLYDEALVEYQKVLDLDPNNAPALFNVGFIAQMKGHLDEAEKALLRADTATPNVPKTLYTLGTVRFERGDFASAISLFERVIAAEPEHQQVHYYYARALSKMGRAEEARRELAIHQEITRKALANEKVPSTMGGD